MQPHSNVIQFTKRTPDDSPRFIAWRWGRNAITITVEDFDADNVDGATLLSFSPEVGVEIGEPTVLALSGEPSMLKFKGSFTEQRDFFIREWDGLANENKRPAIFDEEGLPGLARLPKLSPPSLPEIDEAATAHANEVMRVARERVAEISKTDDLTLDDCIEIAAAVGAELGGADGGPRAA